MRAMDPAGRRVEAFLDRDLRQVWAVDRTTGEPHFLPDGAAERLREIAKAQWKCPIPDCVATLTTRGGSKRDHFVHLTGGVGQSHGESAAHLSAKAMIARWARGKAGPSWTVAEEVGLKDDQTRFNRRPDVLATDGSTRIAYEVEYKAFAPEAWARKQADFDDNRVIGVWLLGHNRIRPLRPAPGVTHPPHLVDVPFLAGAWARAGRVVLVVNPIEQMVGVLLGNDPDFGGPLYRLQPGAQRAYLAVDRMADCDFDPVHGIVTPAMRLMLASEAADLAATQAAEQARRARSEALRRQHEATLAATTQKRERIGDLQREQAAVWAAHPLRQTLLDRWGRLPDVLTRELTAAWGVWADQTHWHAVIYEHLIHDRRDPFPFSKVASTLSAHGIRLHPTSKVSFRSIIVYLEHLQRHGYVTIGNAPQRTITPLRNVGDPPPKATVAKSQKPPRRPQTPEDFERKWLHSQEYKRLAVRRSGIPEFVLDTTVLGPVTGRRDTRHFQAIIWLTLRESRGRVGTTLQQIASRTGGDLAPVRTYLEHLVEQGWVAVDARGYRMIRGSSR